MRERVWEEAPQLPAQGSMTSLRRQADVILFQPGYDHICVLTFNNFTPGPELSLTSLHIVTGMAATTSINPLDSKGNYSATSNETKLVHWPLMGGLLQG